MKKLTKAILLGAYLCAQGAYAQEITFQLKQMKPYSSEYCDLFWDIKNNTGLNITNITYKISFKEADGSIIYATGLKTGRLKNGVVVELDDGH